LSIVNDVLGALVMRTGEGAPPADSAWDVLEHFCRALRNHEQEREQVRLALEAVREGLGADAAFWCAGDGADDCLQLANAELPAGWYRELTRHLLAESSVRLGPDTSQLLRSFLDPAAKPVAPWPCSVALIRLGRARDAWLGALSFHPRRLFRPTDLGYLRLLRRLLLERQEQGRAARQWRDALADLLRELTDLLDMLPDEAEAMDQLREKLRLSQQRLDRLCRSRG
jgi:hypothetical protein